jgi:hypothetical protein
MFLIARRADRVSAGNVVGGKIFSSVWVGVGLWLILNYFTARCAVFYFTA